MINMTRNEEMFERKLGTYSQNDLVEQKVSANFRVHMSYRTVEFSLISFKN